MGNAIWARKKTVKIMKIDGETIKFKAPIQSGDIVKDYPGHVLLDSEDVKHYGIGAKPIDANRRLEPQRLYFLVELPPQATRRVMSSTGLHMSAKDRLESLMLARRSASDLIILKQPSPDDVRTTRVRMRLPKAELARLMKESRDENEAAEKIVNLFVTRSTATSSLASPAPSSSTSLASPAPSSSTSLASSAPSSSTSLASSAPYSSTSLSSSGPLSGSSQSSSRSGSINSSVLQEEEEAVLKHHQRAVRHRNRDGHKKKVGFLPITEGDIRQAVSH